MTVNIDPESGFCAGVVNAIKLAERAVEDGGKVFSTTRTATHDPTQADNPTAGRAGKVFSLGDIVHNRLEMERLEGLGLGTIDHAGLQEGMTVLVRAHGEPPSTYALAREKGVRVIDATCPVVAKLQKTVAEAHRKMVEVGGQVVILGKRGHAEVVGLTGQIANTVVGAGRADLVRESMGGAEVLVVENEQDLEAVDFGRPIYFLSQTTQSLELFGRLSEVLRARARDRGCLDLSAEAIAPQFLMPFAARPEEQWGSIVTRDGGERAQKEPAKARAERFKQPLIVHDTICRAVANRERRLGDFARAHDVVVFVSGRKSSNGRLLFEACRAANPRSHMVEDETELKSEWFKDGAFTVGVCGATSTPGWVMERVAEAIINY